MTFTGFSTVVWIDEGKSFLVPNISQEFGFCGRLETSVTVTDAKSSYIFLEPDFFKEMPKKLILQEV